MKKIRILSLILLAVVLALSAVACAKTSGGNSKNGSSTDTTDTADTADTYTVLTHTGGEPIYGELQLLKGNKVLLVNKQEVEENDIPFIGISYYNGTFTADGDMISCTVESLSAKIEFKTADDKAAFLAMLEENKEEWGEYDYNMYIEAINDQYAMPEEEFIEEFAGYKVELKTDKAAKTALVIREINSTGSSREYEYYDEASGLVKGVTIIESETSSWHIGYSEDGTITDYPGG
jgi:hypothetical protein